MYGPASALAFALFIAAAVAYINRTARLSRFINEHCPSLWDQVFRQSLFVAMSPSQNPILHRDNARRIDAIVLWNRAADDYPTDPQFHALLKAARWSLAACLPTFLAAIILLGLAGR